MSRQRLGKGLDELSKSRAGEMKVIPLQQDCLKEIIDRLVGIEQKFDLLIELARGYWKES